MFLLDSTDAAIPILYLSYKSRRIAMSPMKAAVIAFSDLSDVSISFAQHIGEKRCSDIAIQLLTDSTCLFEVIFKGSRTSEKLTMIDLAAARQALKDHVIPVTGLVQSRFNIADKRTKKCLKRIFRL